MEWIDSHLDVSRSEARGFCVPRGNYRYFLLKRCRTSPILVLFLGRVACRAVVLESS
jgi:hypothetical protein